MIAELQHVYGANARRLPVAPRYGPATTGPSGTNLARRPARTRGDAPLVPGLHPRYRSGNLPNAKTSASVINATLISIAPAARRTVRATIVPPTRPTVIAMPTMIHCARVKATDPRRIE